MLRTVAARTIEITQRDHSIFACPRHLYIGVVLRPHTVRGESRIQRNTSGVVAATGTTGTSDQSL